MGVGVWVLFVCVWLGFVCFIILHFGHISGRINSVYQRQKVLVHQPF